MDFTAVKFCSCILGLAISSALCYRKLIRDHHIFIILECTKAYCAYRKHTSIYDFHFWAIEISLSTGISLYDKKLPQYHYRYDASLSIEPLDIIYQGFP
jgi:hypothetical protein